MKSKNILFLIIIIVLIASCAPGPNGMADLPDNEGEIAGFWKGLWHGFTMLIMFFISLFNKSVEIYEVHNNGGWYSFGFFLGASIMLGGSCGGASRSRRRRNR